MPNLPSEGGSPGTRGSREEAHGVQPSPDRQLAEVVPCWAALQRASRNKEFSLCSVPIRSVCWDGSAILGGGDSPGGTGAGVRFHTPMESDTGSVLENGWN